MAARAHRRADGPSLSVHLGNAPEPRLRPLFAAAFAGGGLLVGPDEGRIEHHVRVLRIIDESPKHPLPHAVLRPTRKAFVHALPFAIPLGQLVPLCAAVAAKNVMTSVPDYVAIETGQTLIQWIMVAPLTATAFLALKHRAF